tara:strand:+ start:1402 stop:2064 length:663 start_codon:yes stop_codon:yes gene_type:complete
MKKNYWENIYRKKMQLINWPWSELIGLVNKFAIKKNKKKIKVLELGFGNGPNIPFFLSLNMDYTGIEISKTIVNKVKRRFPQIKKNLIHGNFSDLDTFGKNFDLIVDRGSMTHNNSKDIRLSINLAYKAMKKGSIYIGIDWMSTEHSSFKSGSFSDDKRTKYKFKKGGFKGVGNVHFFNQAEIKDIFKKWKLLYLNKKNLISFIPRNKFNYSTWSLVAKK